MIESVVGVALRAIVASVVLGAVLSGLVLLATRRLALTAATRHALWTTAMIATAVMPLAGIAVSLVRAAPAERAVVWHPTTSAAEPSYARGATQAARSAETTSHPIGTSAALRDVTTVVAGRTPRVTRALALGVVGVWALGALIGLAGLISSLSRVRGLKRRSSPLDGALADDLPWLTEPGSGREIYLRLSYEIETPVAIGFGRPVILIPTELTADGGLEALEPLVLHEHAHLRRYDDWTNLIQRTIERVFWFNPVVWIVGRRIALEREIASDDAVVERTGEAHAYATSLWKLAREMRMPEHAVVAPGALLTRKQIAVRIEQLLDANRGRLHRSPAAALITACAGIAAVAFVATSAPALELPTQPEASMTAQVAHPATHVWPAGAAPIRKQPAQTRFTVATARPNPQPAAHVTATQPVKTTSTKIVYVRVPATSTATKTSAVAQLPQAPPAPVAPLAAPPPSLEATPATHSLEQIGPTIDNVVTKALARLPVQLAQLDGGDSSHRSPPKGATLSRELLMSCLGCSFRNADLHGLDLHGISLKGDDFNGADLHGANLAGAKLTGVSLRGTNLTNADLRGAVLTGVSLHGVALTGARVDDLTLFGVSLRDVGTSGVPIRSLLAHCTGCDLSRMDLHGIDLHGLSLTGADLTHADLHGANLSGAHLAGVDLSGANLTGADLTNAELEGCDLHGIVLHDALSTGLRLVGSSLGD